MYSLGVYTHPRRVASGLVNTSYQIGSAVGLAALTVLSSTVAAGAIDPEALTGGYSAAYVGAAVVAALGGVITLAALRTRQGTNATEPEPELVTG